MPVLWMSIIPLLLHFFGHASSYIGGGGREGGREGWRERERERGRSVLWMNIRPTSNQCKFNQYESSIHDFQNNSSVYQSNTVPHTYIITENLKSQISSTPHTNLANFIPRTFLSCARAPQRVKELLDSGVGPDSYRDKVCLVTLIRRPGPVMSSALN